ncbi:MAG: leucine-rich repeat domain-containing protein [Roseburia sp.]|jgi:hypothetical protein|nr:leucine-rich repeat domain-containing protein [Roseburia sp.]
MSDTNWRTFLEDFEERFINDDNEEPEDHKPDRAKPAGGFYVVEGRLGRYNGPGGDVSIPEGITEIGNGAFQNCDSVTGITIPKSVIRIWPGVLQYCVNLKEIRVDAGNQRYCVIDGLLLERNGMILHSCPPTKSGVLKIPEGVTEIGENALTFCSGLTGIIIPESVTRIGWQAFALCSGLTSVTIPKYTTHIGAFAFYRCTNLTRVVIPKSVVEIADRAFADCTALSEIQADAGNPFYCVINGLLLNRDGSVLYQCLPITSGVLVIPDGVIKIADGAFAGCRSLTEVIIPGSVRDIGWYAFAGCMGLTHVTIPEGVTSIADDAFAGCTGLIDVAVPKSVAYIGSGAFDNTGLAEETIQAIYSQAKETELELMQEPFQWPGFPGDEEK